MFVKRFPLNVMNYRVHVNCVMVSVMKIGILCMLQKQRKWHVIGIFYIKTVSSFKLKWAKICSNKYENQFNPHLFIYFLNLFSSFYFYISQIFFFSLIFCSIWFMQDEGEKHQLTSLWLFFFYPPICLINFLFLLHTWNNFFYHHHHGQINIIFFENQKIA